MKPTQEELELKSDDELDELSAFVCMSLHLSTDINGQPAYADTNNRLFNDNGIWQPTQNTTKGKAQCWDLMVKCNLIVDVHFSGEHYISYQDDDNADGEGVIVISNETELQKAVVIAAILSLSEDE